MFSKQGPDSNKTVPLLTYWTRLYVLVLLLCLTLMAVISGLWIRINAYNQRFDLLEVRADHLAEDFGQKLESGIPVDRLQFSRAFRTGQPAMPLLVQVADQSGRLQAVKSPRIPVSAPPAAFPGESLPALLEDPPPTLRDVLKGDTVREKIGLNAQTWLRVGVPVYQKGVVTRALYVSMPTRGVLLQVRQLYGSLALITLTIGVAGWLVLYFLSRKLARPLSQVAGAAQSIARGNYSPDLPRQLKERELQQLVVSFREMASQLEKLERLRSDLLAGVSHELRTPVTSIRGMIQAVQGGVVTGEQAGEFMRISLEEAKRLQRMVEELLDFSSLEAGAEPIERDPVDLARLVDEVIQQVRALPGFVGVCLKPAIFRSPAWVTGDSGRIRQVLLNLIDNSQRASATEIKIALGAEGGRVTLDVQDNGVGIAPEDQPYIFERFYRGGPGKAKPHGLGLGLTVSRLLARAHGGELALVETSPGGATFRLELPPGPPGRNEKAE